MADTRQMSKIANENVKPGMTLWLKSKSLGQALVKVVEDRGVDGWLIEIVDGSLYGPATKTRWKVGEQLSIKPYAVEKWYELAGGAA